MPSPGPRHCRLTDVRQAPYSAGLSTSSTATRRGEVTGPSTWDGYAAAAVCEAGVRALEGGGRVEVDLVEKPPLYR